jgi:catechol 2,3-dioxygenase-like lactoylglutathione lyase family enzyme
MAAAVTAGIYEVCIGVTDAIAALQYWQQFGYRIEQTGELTAEAATQLYGVASGLRSIRLAHQNADHGLVRLMIWDQPTSLGLGLGSMKVKGNRWATTLTADLLSLWNHVEDAEAAQLPIRATRPHWEVIYQKDRISRPFLDPAIGVREMMVLQPLTRQVFFQRFDYTLPNYGQINDSTPFKASQFTHCGLVIQDDSKASLRFYEEVLGLLRVRDDVETSYESSVAGREIFDLAPGEKFWVTAFDEPRSSATDLQAARSGRLYIIRFPEVLLLSDRHAEAKPGCLGMSLYTYQVQGLEEFRDRLQTSPAPNITPILSNEFQEPSLSFTAPDGYAWNLIDRV